MLKSLPLPEDRTWDAPDQDDYYGYRVTKGGELQSPKEGELWLYRCRREAYYQCMAGTSIRILPAHKTRPGPASWRRGPEGPDIDPNHPVRQNPPPEQLEVTVSDDTVHYEDGDGSTSKFSFDPQ